MNAGKHRTRSCGDSGCCSHLGLRLTWSLILLLLILTCQVFVLLGVGFAVLALALFLLGCCVLAIGHLRARFVFFVKLYNLLWFPRWQVDMGTWLDWVLCFKKLFLEWGIRSFFSSGRSLQKAFALPFKAAGQLRTEKGYVIPENICNLLKTCILIAKLSQADEWNIDPPLFSSICRWCQGGRETAV